MFGIAFGLGLGTLAGVSVGPYIFPRVTKPKDYSLDLGAKADANEDNEQERHQGAIGAEMRNLLQYTEPWTFWPDYQRVAMSNRIVEVMWPTIKVAALKEAFRQMKPILESTVFKPFPFIENIVLGTDSMRDDFPDFSKWIKDREFGVGDFPFRLGGIKAYVTSEDEVVLELPMVWGSNCKFDVGVFLRFWKFRIYVPCTIENLQFKAEARVTLRPLVDTVPCVGGVMISLLSVPHFDLSFKLGGRVDLMALPIIKETIKNVTKMVLDGMLVYPNHMSFPIMKDYGIPPPAKGALNVKLLYAEGFESTKKLYVRFDVRKSRPVFSTAQRVDVPTGKVEWGQEFNLIVDDYIQQRLKISLFADDLGWSDTLLADGELLFGTQVEEDDPDTGEPVLVDNLAEFIKAPLTEVAAEVRLWGLERQGAFAAVGGGAKSMVKGVGSMGRSLAASFKGNAGEVDAKEAHKRAAEATAAALAARQRKELGSVYIKVTFLPFFQPTFDDEEDEEDDDSASVTQSVGNLLANSINRVSLGLQRLSGKVKETARQSMDGRGGGGGGAATSNGSPTAAAGATGAAQVQEAQAKASQGCSCVVS
mmetsp:Transcript_16823/g.36400  ORF Transcript_16823/g.36400 Transcript_16823/m.36400 type:complete len:591 (+) Transcript_16823:224-1996(+)